MEGPLHALETERCTIERWRGYRSSTFYVSLDGETAFLESRSFPWRKSDPPPDTGKPRIAFDELVAALESMGWQREEGAGSAWYAARFMRLVERRARPAPPTFPPRFEADPEPIMEPATVRREPDPPVVEQRPEPPPAPPAPAPAPAVATAVEPPKRRRRLRPITLFSGLGALVAVGSLTLGVAGLGPKHSRTILVPAAKAAATPHTPVHARRAAVALTITAAKSSGLEVRRGSATGPVVFAGTLAPGRTIHVRAPRVWTRFGAPGNVVVHADGRRIDLMGKAERVFTPKS